MPLLQIRALPQKNKDKIQPALKKTCKAIADFCKCDPCHVWATWEEIEGGLYVEGELSSHIQPSETHPPLAQLTCFEGLSDQEIEELLKLASTTLSQALGLGNNIFMTYHEARSGQVIAGNGIVRKK